MVGEQPPVNVRRVGGKHNTVKQADSGFGGRCTSRSSEAPLRPDSPLPVGPLNLMTFATGRIPRAGSRHHSSILAWRIPGTGSLMGCHLWRCNSRTWLKQHSSHSSKTRACQASLFMESLGKNAGVDCHSHLQSLFFGADHYFLRTLCWRLNLSYVGLLSCIK